MADVSPLKVAKGPREESLDPFPQIPLKKGGGFSRIGNGWIPLLQEGRRNDAERLSRVELQVSALHQRENSGDRVVGKLVKVWIAWRLLDL